MSAAGHLAEFEVLVLLAVLRCGVRAYGPSIKDEIAKRTGRPVSRGAVYVTLERLERKGVLTSKMGEPTAMRGGRAKRFFKVTPAGLKALRVSLSDLSRMREGLEPVLGDA